MTATGLFMQTFPTQPVQSPCIGVCELDRSGLCAGCLRTGEEIACWLQFSDAQRAWIMDVALPQRAAGRE